MSSLLHCPLLILLHLLHGPLKAPPLLGQASLQLLLLSGYPCQLLHQLPHPLLVCSTEVLQRHSAFYAGLKGMRRSGTGKWQGGRYRHICAHRHTLVQCTLLTVLWIRCICSAFPFRGHRLSGFQRTASFGLRRTAPAQVTSISAGGRRDSLPICSKQAVQFHFQTRNEETLCGSPLRTEKRTLLPFTLPFVTLVVLASFDQQRRSGGTTRSISAARVNSNYLYT